MNIRHMKQYFSLLLAGLTLVACGKKESADTAATPVADTLSRPLNVREVLGIAIIEPAERIVQLATESGGYVRKVSVRIGDQVREGQSLLLLDTDVENAQVAQARSKIAAQNDAVDAARQQLELLRIKLAKARADLLRDEALFSGNALSRQALDNTRATVPDLEQQIRAQEALTRQQQSRLGEIQADIRYYQALSGQKNVRAPFNGTCLSVDVRVGEYIDAKTSIGEFAPAGPVIALTEIDELFADKIKTGQKAVIRPQGNGGVLTTGTVVLCSPYLRKKSLFSEKAGDLEDRRVREVRVQLDDPSKVLLGARVECLIIVE